MPYISADGSVVEQRSIVRISIFSDIFWSVVNFFGLFIDTLMNPNKQQAYLRDRDLRERREAMNTRRTSLGTGRAANGSNIKTMPKADCGPKG